MPGMTSAMTWWVKGPGLGPMTSSSCSYRARSCSGVIGRASVPHESTATQSTRRKYGSGCTRPRRSCRRTHGGLPTFPHNPSLRLPRFLNLLRGQEILATKPARQPRIALYCGLLGGLDGRRISLRETAHHVPSLVVCPNSCDTGCEGICAGFKATITSITMTRFLGPPVSLMATRTRIPRVTIEVHATHRRWRFRFRTVKHDARGWLEPPSAGKVLARPLEQAVAGGAAATC